MRIVIVITLTAILLTLSAAPVWAHQPFFEEKDITADAPWQVKDASVSTALYATLASAADVDYYTFEGRKGQSVLLEITIPQIDGQALFAPEMALLGPGLAADRLPPRVAVPPGAGSLRIPALTGPAPVFNEPFSRTSYWERQSQRVIIPADGRYVVAVWHDAGEVGRYGFVIGDKERPGGDPAFMRKMRDYWTPLPQPARVQDTGPDVAGRTCGSW
jgi:hypothetical protein